MVAFAFWGRLIKNAAMQTFKRLIMFYKIFSRHTVVFIRQI